MEGAAAASGDGSVVAEGPAKKQKQPPRPKAPHTKPEGLPPPPPKRGRGGGRGDDVAAGGAELPLAAPCGGGVGQQAAGTSAAEATRRKQEAGSAAAAAAVTEALRRQQLPEGIVAQHTKADVMWECQVCGEVGGGVCATGVKEQPPTHLYLPL